MTIDPWFLSRDTRFKIVKVTDNIENQQVPCSSDTEVTISSYLQYTSNLTNDIFVARVLFDYV